MNVKLLEGTIFSPFPLPSYAGQSFEWMDPGTVGRLYGEEHQSDCSLGGAMIAPLPTAYAGDAFEADIVLQAYNYGGTTVYGFFGAGQENSGGVSLGLGYTFK